MDQGNSECKDWQGGCFDSSAILPANYFHVLHGLLFGGMLGGAWDTDLTGTDSRLHWKQGWTKMLEDPVIYATMEKHGSDQDLLNRYPMKNSNILHTWIHN